MDWIADVDKWDKLLHSEGLTDSERVRWIQALTNLHCAIEKARNDAKAKRSHMLVLVEKCRHIGTTQVAADEGIGSRAMRKRRQTFFAQNGTVKAL